MRRTHAGQYYDPVPNHYDGADALEEENERMADQLKEKIGVLKTLSIDINSEVKYQDRLLNEMDEDFEKTGGFLGNTVNRVLRLRKGSHNYYILYLFLFSLGVFIFLWFFIKFR